MVNILIIDEVSSSSIYNKTIYSDFITKYDSAKLFLITSTGGASDDDKQNCEQVCEIQHPTSNGRVELVALDWHAKYHMDFVYTKQEDLILRASYIRQAFKLSNGLSPSSALVFRDKEVMKTHLSSRGIKVPPFERVFSPVNVINFANAHGYPVLVKPTLGSASAGIRVIKDHDDLEMYLTNEFYSRIDEEGKAGTMYHVNGYASDGKIQFIWPFKYISTNLEFTKGKVYGNLSIPESSHLFTKLKAYTQQVLDNLPCPPNLVFHLELFEHDAEFLICEIAARRPGGSIALLIDSLLGGKKEFPKYEFRLNNGLNVSIDPVNPNMQVGDLMAPRELGTLKELPAKEYPNKNIELKYLVPVNSNYTGFGLNCLNTACRIIGKSESPSETLEHQLNEAYAWFKSNTKYELPQLK
ncbi:hypothetical protein HDV01_007901 [Terramyces sp. JEL0728]|nr:hypothetical protein HDV01_007901 [Terramyces sp. JEL0728]